MTVVGSQIFTVGLRSANVPLSWVHAAAVLDFELRIAAPTEFQPSAETLAKAGGKITCTEDIQAAVDQADMVYTDVWVSMGLESEAEDRLAKLAGYQINAEVMRLANRPDEGHAAPPKTDGSQHIVAAVGDMLASGDMYDD